MDWLPAPTALFTVAGLAGIVVSVSGNETAQRNGHSRMVTAAMGTAAVLSLCTGWMAGVALLPATVQVILWNATIYLNSSALTAGTVPAADPALRGATMGLHSMCGYTGGFLGPLGVGLALDLAGDDVTLGWSWDSDIWRSSRWRDCSCCGGWGVDRRVRVRVVPEYSIGVRIVGRTDRGPAGHTASSERLISRFCLPSCNSQHKEHNKN